MNTENTATPRQRWALFCITKKDYRNEILSIHGNPGNKGAGLLSEGTF